MHHVDYPQVSVCIHWLSNTIAASTNDRRLSPLDPAACPPGFLAPNNLHLAGVSGDGYARTNCYSSLSIIRLASAPLLTFAGLAYGAQKQRATPRGPCKHADGIR